MSIEITRDDVVSYFLDEWSDTPVATDNVKYKTTGVSYIQIRVVPNFSTQPVLGRGTGETWEREVGDIILSVYIPVNSADDGLAIADKARRTLSQQTLGRTLLSVGYTVPAGIAPDKSYYLYNVRIEYRTDNIKQEV